MLKRVLIVLLTLVMILALAVPAFAAGGVDYSAIDTLELPEVTMLDGEEPNYLVLYDTENAIYKMYFFSASFVFYYNQSNNSLRYYSNVEPRLFGSYTYDATVDESWVKGAFYTTTEDGYVTSNGFLLDTYALLYSSVDIYYGVSSTNISDLLFFPRTPLVQVPPLVSVVTDLRDQQILDQVLAGIVQVLPSGLICLVIWISLRKGYSLLMRMLSQA